MFKNKNKRPSVEYLPEDRVRHAGARAIQASTAEQTSPDERPIVPRGWTTLIHGTDSERWQIGETHKRITGMGLSAITAEDVDRNRAMAARIGNPGAFDTTRNYASQGGSGTPVEIRILFYDDMLHYDKPELKDMRRTLDDTTIDLLRRYYQPRHSVVPWGEEIVRLGGGVDETSGRTVEYFVPKSVEANYWAAAQLEAAAQ